MAHTEPNACSEEEEPHLRGLLATIDRPIIAVPRKLETTMRAFGRQRPSILHRPNRFAPQARLEP